MGPPPTEAPVASAQYKWHEGKPPPRPTTSCVRNDAVIPPPRFSAECEYFILGIKMTNSRLIEPKCSSSGCLQARGTRGPSTGLRPSGHVWPCKWRVFPAAHIFLFSWSFCNSIVFRLLGGLLTRQGKQCRGWPCRLNRTAQGGSRYPECCAYLANTLQSKSSLKCTSMISR